MSSPIAPTTIASSNSNDNNKQDAERSGTILMSRLRSDGQIESLLHRSSSTPVATCDINSTKSPAACWIQRISAPIEPLIRPLDRLLKPTLPEFASQQEARAFAFHQLSLRLSPMKRAVALLILIASLMLVTRPLFHFILKTPVNRSQSSPATRGDESEYYNSDDQADSLKLATWILIMTLVFACFLKLTLLIVALYKLHQVENEIFGVDQSTNQRDDQIKQQQQKATNNEDPLAEAKQLVENLETILLITSSALAALIAAQGKQFTAFEPVIMFIVYSLLAADNQKSFATLLIANFIHLISVPLLIKLEIFHYDNDNNDTSALFRFVLVTAIVYIYFHLIGLNLNKQTQDECNESFDDIKNYVKAKLMLDTEDKKLTKLMESVIPKHLAGRMRTDILLPQNNGIFHRIYLDSYDEVSILFADIVNFTKISSACSAQLLVETLNELFGRFDKAADKNHCLRIKILGDCYYCVSGIPDKSSEHAIRSVEMGLDMIDILGDLAQDNSGVDLNMRVGIHSGRVLCGVLGKKKWQFDVHSNDVKLANHTEQSGIPGRVHITEDTLRALGGRYQVEPANGHLRDTFIAQRNISTYFVVPSADRRISLASVGQQATQVQAVAQGLASRQLSPETVASSTIQYPDSQTAAAAMALLSAVKPLASGGGNPQQGGKMRFKLATQRLINALHFIRTIDPPFANLEAPATTLAVAANQGERLMRETILSRCQIQDINGLTLRFKDEHMSQLYSSDGAPNSSEQQLPEPELDPLQQQQQRTPQSGSSCATNECLGPLLLKNRTLMFLSLLLGLLFLLHYTTTTSTATSGQRPDTTITTASQRPYNGSSGPAARGQEPLGTSIMTTLPSHLIEGSQNNNNNSSSSGQVGGVLSVNSGPYDSRWWILAETYCLISEILLVFILGALVYMHQSEYNSRRDFLWRQIAIRDQDRMSLMRDCNRFIFFNLLPPHVASYFLEQSLARSHMDLYYKSYERIGVIFATISNFSDFYSEVQGNNHGLECLRLLNEIICDFDSILDDDRFESVDKIKTIGSTYMAAIGLFPEHELPADSIGDPLVTSSSSTNDASNGGGSEQNNDNDVAHDNNLDVPFATTTTTESSIATSTLAARKQVARYMQILVRFVIEMKAKLQDINENSYNCFKLRVGINLGPVTAGVIGASKPQYDIWGNTVNVASRMESTAEPNKIQITEEVYEILNDFNEDTKFAFTCRGSINVKGKGFMTTYYLDYEPSQYSS